MRDIQGNFAGLVPGFGGAQGFVIIRHQVFHVGDDFNLNEVAATSLSCYTGDAHCLFGIAGTGGVGQQAHLLGNILQNVFRWFVTVDAPQGYGNHLRTTGGKHCRDMRMGRKLASAGKEAAGETGIAQY